MLLTILSCKPKTYFMKLRLFIRFLKAYGLYEEYFGELGHSQGPNYTNQFFRDCLSRLKPDRYIVTPINWYETSRGSYFWSMVNDTWINYLNRHTFKS